MTKEEINQLADEVWESHVIPDIQRARQELVNAVRTIRAEKPEAELASLIAEITDSILVSGANIAFRTARELVTRVICECKSEAGA